MSAMDELMDMAKGESSSQTPPARKRARKAKVLTETMRTPAVDGSKVASAGFCWVVQ
jgi:dienelactone hydrolase